MRGFQGGEAKNKERIQCEKWANCSKEEERKKTQLFTNKTTKQKQERKNGGIDSVIEGIVPRTDFGTGFDKKGKSWQKAKKKKQKKLFELKLEKKFFYFLV